MPIDVEKTPLGIKGLARYDGKLIDINVTQLTQIKNALGIGLQGLVTLRVHVFDQVITVFRGRCNFLSTSDKQSIAKQIKKMRLKQLDGINWDEFIEALSQAVLDCYFEPIRPERLTPEFENPQLEFLLEPLLPKGFPVLIYAPGGSGKSLIALLLALLVRNGIDLNFQKTTEPVEVLYLDWELSKKEANRRLGMLVPPWDASKVEYPLYVRCLRPFSDSIQDILQIVIEEGIKFVIIDSATPAIGSDINDNTLVAQFFQDIAQLTALDVTVLILTHVSKAHKDKEDGAMPIGAIMFENLSRVTWELKYLEVGSTTKFGLYCRKSNFGHLKSVGLAFHFSSDGTFVERLPEPDEVFTNKKITQAEIIIAALAERPMSVTELAEVTGINKDVIWTILPTLKKEGRVKNVERGKWALNGSGRNPNC